MSDAELLRNKLPGLVSNNRTSWASFKRGIFAGLSKDEVDLGGSLGD